VAARNKFGEGERVIESGVPAPQRVMNTRRGESKYGLHDAKVGENNLRVKTSIGAARDAVRRYRRDKDAKAKFVVRPAEEGWVRIWRVK
jgi:hypothetical protein